MRAVPGKEFCKILERHGWTLDLVNGSHFIDKRPGVRALISVPVHGNEFLGTGLQRKFMKNAGLSEADL